MMDGIRYRNPEELVDSGIEWLGKIPKNWSLSLLGYHSKMIVPMRDKPPIFDGNIPWIRIEDFNGKYIQESKSNQKVSLKTIRDMNLKIYPVDSVLCTCSCNLGTVAIVKRKIISNQTFICIVPNSKLKTNFLYYLMGSNAERLQFLSIGAIQQYLSREDFKHLKIQLPSCQEQKIISNFLDYKTSQFDSIIEKKEQLIQKLNEAKKSLISEVITGKVKIVDGVLVERDPSEMKDSGIGWLGLIPRDWSVKQIRYLFRLRNERNIKPMDKIQILTLYTAYGVRRQEDVDNKTGNIVRTVEDYKLVYPKDIVVNIILAWMGSIGVSNYKGVISPAYDIYEPIYGQNSFYFNHLFRTPKFAGECFKRGKGIMLMRLRTYSDDFKSINICCPSLIEQQLIADFLDCKVSEFEKIIIKQNLFIEELKQARQSLISEAVTGKIDLRDWQIIEQEAVS